MPPPRRYIHAELKRLVVKLTNDGLDRTHIRQVTGVAESSQRRICALYRATGSVERIPIGRGRPCGLCALDLSFLEGCIERRPDITLEELQHELEDVCSVRVSLSTLSRGLQKRGLVRKKLSRPAVERNDDDRRQFKLRIGHLYQPQQLVFIDESHCDRLTARRQHGWCRLGRRPQRREFFLRGTKYSIVPALSLSGIVALDVFQGAVTQELFDNFIEHVLDRMNPFPQPNSVLIMDNASIHHSDRIRDLVEGRGMRLEYLPAYSPDLNPIEEAFSAIKAWIRSNRDYVLSEMGRGPAVDPYAAIWQAVFSVTPIKAEVWFRHAGYLRAIRRV